jgi:hypothetical protein
MAIVLLISIMVVCFAIGYMTSSTFLTLKHHKNLEKLYEAHVHDMRGARIAGSVNYRFKQIKKLTEKQFDIAKMIEGPSRGPSFSKYRRQAQKDIQELEDQKLEIFRSMVDDNVDPLISTLDLQGNERKLRVSEMLAEQEAKSTTKPNTDPNNHRVAHLSLVKEQDDGKDSSGKQDDPTLH